MKFRLTEQTVLFFSVLKWFVVATIVGTVTGFVSSVFLKLLDLGTDLFFQNHYLFLLLPVGLFVNAIIGHVLVPSADAHTTDRVIDAIHDTRRLGIISPLKAFVLPLITITVGGSAGKEAPCADMGAGIGSLLADIFRFDKEDRKKIMICGVSAGFASVFGVPISGAIFGVEVLFVGSMLYDVLLPSFIAGITGYQVSRALGITYFYHPLNFVPVFSESFLVIVVFAGIFFGLCSGLLITVLKWGERFANKLKWWLPLKGFVGGVILIALAFILSNQFLGLGLRTIESSLEGEKVVWYAFLAKIVTTSLTLNFGGSGGIVTPIFFIGSTAGALFAQLFDLNVATFAAIGLVSVLAGAANTPIAASIMSVELFGPQIAPYAVVACIISFLVTGHRSVFPSQVLAIAKSSSIQVEIGKEIEDLVPLYQRREIGVVQWYLAALRVLKRMKWKKNPEE
ncbi:MAG: chloride channel protein [Bacteroidota bacterium]|nr:chloride channel protein [Bacteroidota bacterium]